MGKKCKRVNGDGNKNKALNNCVSTKQPRWLKWAENIVLKL